MYIVKKIIIQPEQILIYSKSREKGNYVCKKEKTTNFNATVYSALNRRVDDVIPRDGLTVHSLTLTGP